MITPKKVSKFKLDLLKDLLHQCTVNQQERFHSIYGDINKIPEEKIDLAIIQCEKTTELNSLNNTL
jgi:hypothetical protein